MDFAELATMASAHGDARAIQTALKLGLFEALQEGALGEADLARKIGAQTRTTAILGNAMVALGLLEKTAGRFALAAVARRFLVESSVEYLGAMVLFDEALWDLWGRLDQAVLSGRPVRTPDMFQGRPEETARFIRAMDSLVRARGDARYLVEHLDLSAVASIGDVGGGAGTYVAAFARRWPKLRAAIYDLPATLEVAGVLLSEREPEVCERIDLVAVDYVKDEIPGPNDALFVSNVIHGEVEETNAELMRKCFRALSPGGLLVVKDHIMNDELTAPRAGAVFSLYLLLATPGRNYSASEVRAWVRAAGFATVDERPLPSPPFTSSLILARKP
jgi:3-hydroxy-5-methyl-1-naphthoate 3-O-methyltransferase